MSVLDTDYLKETYLNSILQIWSDVRLHRQRFSGGDLPVFYSGLVLVYLRDIWGYSDG